MATIVVKNLSESIDLDRQAMAAIAGGARIRGRTIAPAQTLLRSTRIVSYPPGFAGRGPVAAGKPVK
ncbi:MAG: hypothetical protein H6R10_3574 [Rhodocyclaceae bacterium]|nr:hypothetical protein [Rhodocyclaceae bacterium]